MPTSRPARLLERLLIGLCALALSVGVIALLSGFFAARDAAGVGGSPAVAAAGTVFADLGSTRLRRGELRPPYNSDPPTSGAHVPTPVTREGSHLSDDQILTALAAGDVVVLYGAPHSPISLRRLASEVAGPFTPALARSGQAIVYGTRAGIDGLVALAWTRRLRVRDATDPALIAFAQSWLGSATAGR